MTRPKDGSAATRLDVTAIFERHGTWYVGYVPEVPGVNAQERTLAAARKSLVSALRELAQLDPQAVRGKGRTVERLAVELAGR